MEPLNFSPEDLADLIEQLRLAGFKVGAGQHIDAQNLLALLAARGRLDDAPRGLGTWLAPILCKSPAEQAAFYRLFKEWCEVRRAEEPAHLTPGRLPQSRWLWRSAAAALLVAVAFVTIKNCAFSTDKPPIIVTPTPTPDPGVTIIPFWPYGGVWWIVALSFAGWWLWNSPRASKLVRWRAESGQSLERLSVKGVGERLFGDMHALRRHRSIPSGELDINSTVDATARNAGWFTPVYGFKRAAPEYLLMIDRVSYRDHQASLGEALYERLKDEGVSVSRYFFHSDPRLCRGNDPAEPHLTLEDLASLHPEHELILFGDGEGLLDPLTGRPARWLSLLPPRPTRVLLTPLPRPLWGQREGALAQEGFLVIHADSPGVARLADKIAASAEIERAGWRPGYPEALKQRPERWLIDDPPPPDALKRLTFELRLFMGAEGYRWLCACALYPIILWDVTLYLGRGIVQGSDFEENLAKLVQLPWFRRGVMPGWLRLQLVRGLGDEHKREVLQALSDLLASCGEGVCDPFELEIRARRVSPGARRERGNEVLHDYVEAHPESPLRDYVLLTHMSGLEPSELALDVPDEVLERLRPPDKTGWAVTSLNVALVVAACLILSTVTLSRTAVGLVLGLLTVISNIVLIFQLNLWGLGDLASAWRSTLGGLRTGVGRLRIKRLIRVYKMRRPARREEVKRVEGRHPPGLYVLFTAEMLERFSFYSMLALFTLYLRDPAEGFGWTAERATVLYSWYLMFVYTSPLVGGFLADRVLGRWRAVMAGGLFYAAGYGLLSYRSLTMVYAALVCLVIGNGFFKPNVSTMVGNLYPEGSHLKDRAYNIFYMGINIGALVAPIVMQVVKQTFGVHPAFAVASFAMLFSVLVVWSMRRHVEKADGPAREESGAKADAEAFAPGSEPAPDVVHNPIDAVPEWRRIGALFIIFANVIVFWMVFHQSGSTLIYWADDNTAWDVSGTISNAINPFWIISLTFPLVWFWKWLDAKGLEPSTPTKMVFGMILTAASFLVLYFAARVGEAAVGGGGPYDYRVSPAWLVSAYAVISLGELMLSPMGLSLVSKIAPRRRRGLMMGGWFLATAIGNKLTAVGVYWSYWQHSSFFIVMSASALVMAFVLLTLLRPLKKAMPGV